jgi:hypothetical protein
MTTSAAPRRPPGRYDEPKPLGRPVLISGAVVLIGVLVVIAYVAFTYYSGNRITFTEDGYTIRSDKDIRLTFTVTKDEDQYVECELQARDGDQVEVGFLLVTIGESDSANVETTSDIPTKRRASGAEVLSCRPIASTR